MKTFETLQQASTCRAPTSAPVCRQAPVLPAAPRLQTQLQAMLADGVLRAKHAVGAHDDPAEAEADRMVDAALAGRPAAGSHSAGGATCQACAGAQGWVRRKPRGAAALTSMGNLSLGTGQPLTPRERGFFEWRYATDLSDVRIHDNPMAARAAAQLDTRAFSVGPQIAFGAGEYRPDSSSGRRLLGHELAHVVQGHSGIRRGGSKGTTVATPPPTGVPVPATGQAAARPAKPQSATSDAGPLRPSTDSYPFRGVRMTGDEAFMMGELRLLIRRYGLRGGELWFDALQGRGRDIALPFSATARAFGGPRARGPLDVQRDMQDESRKARIAHIAVPLAIRLYPIVRIEALKFLSTFRAAMKTTLDSVLLESERRIDTERVRYGLSRKGDAGLGAQYEAKNTTAMQGLIGASKDLLEIRLRIEGLQAKQRKLMFSRGKGGFVQPAANRARHEALREQVKTLEADYAHARAGAALRHPALGAILDGGSALNATAQLRSLARGDLKSGRPVFISGPLNAAGLIGFTLDSHQRSIDTVRSKVASDGEKLWSIDAIVHLTRIVMGTANKTMADRLIDDKLADLRFIDEIQTLFLGLMALVLAIPTGGGSLVGGGVAAASATLGIHQAMKSLDKYQFEMALTQTDLDKRAYALATEEPSAFWLALDIVFVVADGAAALKAFRTLKNEARVIALAKDGIDATQAEARLIQAVDSLKGVDKDRLTERLRDSLTQLRGQSPEARALGNVGKGEAEAIARVGRQIAGEAKAAQTIATVGGHEVKVTRSGHLVVCSECTWLRERFARELAADRKLLARMQAAEDQVRLAPHALDAAVKGEISALTHKLQGARAANLVAELGPVGLEAMIKRYPHLADELTRVKGLAGQAEKAGVAELATRAEVIAEAEKMPMEELERLLDRSTFAPGTQMGNDLRFVRYQRKGGRLAYDVWEPMAYRIWENRGVGTLTEVELKEAFGLGKKNELTFAHPSGELKSFKPDHIRGDPTAIEWGKAYHFEEIKDWKDMSDTGNLSAMLDYVEKVQPNSKLTIYYKSNAYMSGPLRTRIKGLMDRGKVDLIPFSGR